MKLNQKQWNFIIFILFATTTILVLIATYQLKIQKDTCLSNPLIYGAKRLSEVNDAEFSCTCYLAVPISPIVKFDQYGMNVEHQYKEVKKYEYNFSKIEEMFEN